MSDNCCRKKSNGDFDDQENRLTNRHIQTLGLLQDLHRENKELKTRVEELEAELSNCAEYHSIATDAKGFMQKAQEDCIQQIDNSNEKLTRKHKEEVMKLISAKLEAESEWLQERDQLQSLINGHEKQNAALMDQLESLKKHDLKVDVINQQLDRTIAEMMELKETNSQLNLQVMHLEEKENAEAAKHLARLQEVEHEKELVSLELQEVNQKLKEFELRVKVLEGELSYLSNDSKERNSANYKLRRQMEKASKEVTDYQRHISELEEVVSNLNQKLTERTSQVEAEAHAKEKLLMLLQHMQEECQMMKKMLATREKEKEPTVERVGFREFVQMRRELNALREENNFMKQGRRKHQSLPSLKTASPDGHTANDAVPGKQRWCDVRQSKSVSAIQAYKR